MLNVSLCTPGSSFDLHLSLYHSFYRTRVDLRTGVGNPDKGRRASKRKLSQTKCILVCSLSVKELIYSKCARSIVVHKSIIKCFDEITHYLKLPFCNPWLLIDK